MFTGARPRGSTDKVGSARMLVISRQDGSIGKHGSPPHTTTSKLQLKYRTSLSHHSELSEVELSGSLTATELKKPHPSRLVAGVETGNGLVPHLRVMDKILEGTFWE